MHPDAQQLIQGFENALRSEWRQFREQSFNANTKGEAYEIALMNLLDQYFGSVLKFRNRSKMVDSELECFTLFSDGENEFDIVASYRATTPNIVFEIGEMTWVPYDGVSFVVEVKKNLTKTNFKADLEKLQKLSALRGDSSGRFHQHTRSAYSVNHQLRCLVYDEEEISDASKNELMEEYKDIWDLILIVENDEIYINSTLPILEFLFPDDGDWSPHWIYTENGLALFILAVAVSIPYPHTVYAADPILNLIGQQEDLTVTAGRISKKT